MRMNYFPIFPLTWYVFDVDLSEYKLSIYLSAIEA
jgi:hypothetical protein